MARFLGNNESALASASSQFWVVDAVVSIMLKLICFYHDNLHQEKLKIKKDLMILFKYRYVYASRRTKSGT